MAHHWRNDKEHVHTMGILSILAKENGHLQINTGSVKFSRHTIDGSERHCAK